MYSESSAKPAGVGQHHFIDLEKVKLVGPTGTYGALAAHASSIAYYVTIDVCGKQIWV